MVALGPGPLFFVCGLSFELARSHPGRSINETSTAISRVSAARGFLPKTALNRSRRIRREGRPSLVPKGHPTIAQGFNVLPWVVRRLLRARMFARRPRGLPGLALVVLVIG